MDTLSLAKRLWVSGAVLAVLAVMLGAFGAHGLEAMLEASGRTATFETAVKYHFYHALGLLLLGLWAARLQDGQQQAARRLLQWAGHALFWGTLVFSGTLYVLCLTGIGWLGAITPLGGVALIIGWTLAALAGYKS